jgi:glycosyltransferase involved in cell wall biosynthesis
MRIAHVDSERDFRGGQVQVAGLVAALARRGHAQLLSCPGGTLAERARAVGCVWHRWRACNDLDLAAAASLWARWRDFRPDVVHLHAGRAHAAGALAARLLGSPAIVVSRRVAYPPGRGPLDRLKYGAGADRYLCVSAAVAVVLEAAGVARERIAVVRAAVAREGLERRDAGALRERLGVAGGVAVIGALGALDRDKGHHVLVEAFAALRARRGEVRLVLFGEGPEHAALGRLLEARGLAADASLPGRTKDPLTALSLFDVLAQPSLVEGLGGSVLEAQALGVPVVASRAGGLPEIVEDGESGWLVPPGDARALAAALEQVLGDPTEAARRAACARARVLRRTLDTVAEETERGYRVALEAHAMRGARR